MVLRAAFQPLFFVVMAKIFLKSFIKSMHINSVANNSYNTKFGNWSREVYLRKDNGQITAIEKKDGNNNRLFPGELIHRNDTCLYRDGAYWKFFTNFLIDHFKDTPKVNLYCYGCSNGSEPYTLAMQLISNYPEEAGKFLPVMAKDYDKTAIDIAKSGKIPLTKMEMDYANYYTHDKLNGFIDTSAKNKKRFNVKMSSFYNELSQDVNIPGFEFKQTPDMEYLVNHEYTVMPLLRTSVDFSVADILHDYRKIKPKNSVVMARNFLPYLEPNKTVRLIYNLGERLKGNSLLVLGTYDMECCTEHKNMDLPRLLNLAGFKQTKLENVFEKAARKAI